MSEIREISTPLLAEKIVGADLNAPETADSRRQVPKRALEKALGRDLRVDTPAEARAYLKYLAANDGGDPTRITVGGWAHRTLFGLAHSANLRRPATKPKQASGRTMPVAARPGEPAQKAPPVRDSYAEPELELVDPATGRTVER